MKELEMILAAVAQLGEAGKEAFIWWLVMDKGLGFLGTLSVLVSLLFGVRMSLSYFSQDTAARNIRDEMGIGTRGPVTRGELDAMYQWVRERKDKK